VSSKATLRRTRRFFSRGKGLPLASYHSDSIMISSEGETTVPAAAVLFVICHNIFEGLVDNGIGKQDDLQLDAVEPGPILTEPKSV